VQFELSPCQCFKKFIKRSRTTRQNDDSICVHEHDFFALVHRFGDHKCVQIPLSDFPVHQMGRDHAKCGAACVLYGICDAAHQSDITRTINQTPCIGGKHAACIGGRLGV